MQTGCLNSFLSPSFDQKSPELSQPAAQLTVAESPARSRGLLHLLPERFEGHTQHSGGTKVLLARS